MTPKCPKCGGQKLNISQHGELVDTYRQDDKDNLSVDTVNQDYTPGRVKAKCLNPDCAWQWTLRGIIHISDLDGYVLNQRAALERAKKKAGIT
jgi:hypothetical protein